MANGFCLLKYRVSGITALLIITAACSSQPDDLTPRQQLVSAWQAYRLADYKQALRLFESIDQDPRATPGERRQALYGSATTHDLRQPIPTQDNELATRLYQHIIRESPASDEAAWSALALARMLHLVSVGEEPDYPQVRAAYQSVIDAYPDHSAGQEALMYQQSTLIMTLEPEYAREAIARLHQFLEDYPMSSFQSAAHNLLAQAYETLGDHDTQLQARIRELETLEIDPDSPASADLSWRYWQIATTAEFSCGNFETARAYYQRLIDEYPLDFRKFPAKQALARMDHVEKELRASR